MGPESTSISSSDPNLLNNLIGSSDPFDGLIMDGPLLLFLTCLCDLTVEDDAAGLEDDATDCCLVPVVEEEVGAVVEGTYDEEGGSADVTDDVDGAVVMAGCTV